jgi:hypothetical protein
VHKQLDFGDELVSHLVIGTGEDCKLLTCEQAFHVILEALIRPQVAFERD